MDWVNIEILLRHLADQNDKVEIIVLRVIINWIFINSTMAILDRLDFILQAVEWAKSKGIILLSASKR